ncbi:MAG: hypothetical protein ACHQRO_03110 [Vicinamibacteria bacterium]|jgi:hypothetical protein
MFLRFAAAALLTVASVSSAGPAEPPNGGCACPNGAEQLLEQIDHVFIGDLVEVKGIGDDVGTALIRVRENFKGELSGVVEVRDAASTKCSWSVFEMAAPGRYVIFANLDEGELVTPAFCPQTQPLSGWKDKLGPFRAYARAHRPPTTTGGRAAAAKPPKGVPTQKAGS